MKIIKLDAIDSTNDHLKALSKKVILDDATIVTAKNQTKGKGQRQAFWHIEVGKSLAFSVFKKFKGWPAVRAFEINCAVALGLLNGLERLGVENICVKWPNDILSDRKKLCGILIENQLKSDVVVSSIIGIGLNVNNETFPELPQASSLYLTQGRKFDLDEVLMVLTKTVLSEIEKLEVRKPESLYSAYESRLFRLHQVAAFENANGEIFNGILRGVSPEGELLLEQEDEGVHSYGIKEIKFIY
ncbi:MAG: biotin--[acetyl-CoA-carboxylase] ligase [Bacteroidota bacterium]